MRPKRVMIPKQVMILSGGRHLTRGGQKSDLEPLAVEAAVARCRVIASDD